MLNGQFGTNRLVQGLLGLFTSFFLNYLGCLSLAENLLIPKGTCQTSYLHMEVAPPKCKHLCGRKCSNVKHGSSSIKLWNKIYSILLARELLLLLKFENLKLHIVVGALLWETQALVGALLAKYKNV